MWDEKIFQKGGLLTENTWKHAKLNGASIYSNYFPEMYGVTIICRVMLLICKHLENCQMFLWIFMSPQCFTAFSTGGHLPKNSSRKSTIYCSPFIFLLLKRFVIQLGNKISGLWGRTWSNPCSGQLKWIALSKPCTEHYFFKQLSKYLSTVRPPGYTLSFYFPIYSPSTTIELQT